MANANNTKKKNRKVSIADSIVKVVNKHPRTADEFKKELKDKFGYNEKLDDIRVNLLYLLRRGKVKRKRDEKVYKYYI